MVLPHETRMKKKTDEKENCSSSFVCDFAAARILRGSCLPWRLVSVLSSLAAGCRVGF